jgi:osmoprotectant transport system permease protein
MGTGIKPSLVALTILAVPPILINTIQAFRSLSPATLEAAAGMGMSPSQSFFMVKIPLSFPFMYAGIRTAVVEVISSATLASYIGAGGLGDIIFTGLALLRYDLLIIGGGSVAILSLGTGFMLDSIYKHITRYQHIT